MNTRHESHSERQTADIAADLARRLPQQEPAFQPL